MQPGFRPRLVEFLLTIKVTRPKLALTAGAGLLMSAAVEEKDASSQSFFEKAPRKSHRRDQKALWQRPLIIGPQLFQRGSEARLS